jgi:hypothetical protein
LPRLAFGAQYNQEARMKKGNVCFKFADIAFPYYLRQTVGLLKVLFHPFEKAFFVFTRVGFKVRRVLQFLQ